MRSLVVVALVVLASCGRSELLPDRRSSAAASVAVPMTCSWSAAPSVPAVFGHGFQSNLGTGVSKAITVDFVCPVSHVAITVLDPDYDTNAMVAFDASGHELARATFQADMVPGRFTTDRRELFAQGIVRVELRPGARDFVAWDELVAD